MTTDTRSAWADFMEDARERVQAPVPLETRGTLTRLTGLVLEAAGIRVPVGSQCMVQMPGHTPILAEVVGFSADRAFLMPAGDIHGLSSGASVVPAAPYIPMPRLGEPPRPVHRAGVLRLPMGDGLLGRVVDSQGFAINALLTVGRGQRLGLFAGSGVGKSVLLGMMARYTQADVIVVGLIGERGREVKEFVEDILGADGRARSVVVAAPADAPPLLRMQGAAYATAVAEHFRDKGKHVLLLMDSLTRYAMAQREIALAIGEPPATKGYPPSCFAKLPALVERSGNGLHGVGSITAFYTVLSEGDDQQDPIADAARAILDGHIVLSRALAETGHFPAIDIEQSASRVMHNVVSREHFDLARRFRAVYSRYQKSRDLVQVGAYMSGSDPALDEAIRLQPQMAAFLQQDMFDAAAMEQSLHAMAAVLGR
ncbi:MAG: flagellum-specific ATP synthase FliI [Acidovorax sp. 17-64-282]|nr:MAG: flagellum-specific ATP synthase FliI [Acidovorax sp. 17-64-282]